MNIDKCGGDRKQIEELAMDMRRILGNDIFSRALIDRINHLNVDYVIIDDLRYPHELDTLRKYYDMYLIQTTSLSIEKARPMDAFRYFEFEDHVEKVGQAFYVLPELYEDLYSSVDNILELVS